MLSLRRNCMSSFVIVLFLFSSLIIIVGKLRPWPRTLPPELLALDLATRIFVDPDATAAASTDFGHVTRVVPAAVLHPESDDDISELVRFAYTSPQPFTIAARGHGHSFRGQASAPDGVVVKMRSLNSGVHTVPRINVVPSGTTTTATATAGNSSSAAAYVDAGGEQLWIDVLHETLKHGLAPKSWTDYLYLTVGGTLSNAGVSGQAFRYGPQISNVYELDVVTGKGEKMTCSKELNPDLFYAVLGGLGQFGIITRARIALQPAPQRVRWVRLIYTDLGSFTGDQEYLISLEGTAGKRRKRGFDYVEGSLLVDQSPINNWRSSFFSDTDLVRIRSLAAQHGVLYCIEGSMYYDHVTGTTVDQEVGGLLQDLSFVPGFVFNNDVSYLQFLDRVREGELKLRAKGLWEVPHPWLNLFIPKSRISDFDTGVFKGILKHHDSMGPILIYPVNRNKWDERMSMVIPDEEIFYSVGFLRSAMGDWEYLENQNMEILKFCDQSGIRYKQYLPHYRTRVDWMKHFGPKWNLFLERKRKYDPKALLSPGQRIFTSPISNAYEL